MNFCPPMDSFWAPAQWETNSSSDAAASIQRHLRESLKHYFETPRLEWLTYEIGHLISSPSLEEAEITVIDPETASKAIELLFKEGLMDQTDHLFTILDLPRLQEALS